MKMMKLGIWLVALFFLLSFSMSLQARPISYIRSSIGTGTIGGTAFANAAYTITGHGDTNDIRICGSIPCLEVNHTSTFIQIQGIGAFEITSALRTFRSNPNNNSVGLSRQNPPGGDLGNVFSDAFIGWDLISNIGPVGGTSNLGQWTNPPVLTSGGILIFNDSNDIPATFQAVLGDYPTSIPTLSEWAQILLALSLMGMAGWYWQRRAS